MNPDSWRTQNATWLASRLRRLRQHMQELAAAQQAHPAASWLVAGELSSEPVTPAAEQALIGIDRRPGEAENALPEFIPALHALAELTGLTDFEQCVLLLAAAPSLDGAFATACAELNGAAHRDHPTLQLALTLFVPTEQRLIAADALMPTRTLRRLRLIEVGDEPGEPLLLRRLSTDERLTNYLRGINHHDERLEPYLTALPAVVVSEPAQVAAQRIQTAIGHDNDTWPTINLIGAVGAVCWDAVGTACHTAGLEPRLLDLTGFADTDPHTRRTLIALLGREALLASLAVLVDTAHAPAPATAVNELIRTLPAPLFLTSVERWATDSPGVRVVHVGAVTRPQQVSMWQRVLSDYPTSINGEIQHIAQQFDFTPDAIVDTVSRAASTADGPITPEGLWDACRDQRSSGLDQFARRIEPCYGWDDIVVDDATRTQLQELADQVRHRPTVYEKWGFGTPLGRGRGITALFAGPSGTGKTMAAEILAGHLRLALHRIDLAGVVSKYIGETEKNLRQVFDAAERSGSILMFDEADALFGTRTDVRDSHDRYANLEINYLLQRMEDYAGLAILATNRRSALDSAFLRRLRFIVDFPFPASAERHRIWEQVLPPAAQRGELDYGTLSQLEIAGGNIRSIAVNAAFLAASDGGAIEMEHLVRAAGREYAKLGKPVSAAEFGDWQNRVRS
jgi:hypothetical protein